MLLQRQGGLFLELRYLEPCEVADLFRDDGVLAVAAFVEDAALLEDDEPLEAAAAKRNRQS